MDLEEQKQVLIDYFVNLLRIKKAEKAENEELDAQIQIAKIKLSSYTIDIESIERMIFPNKKKDE
ncbi:MAG: hypothetical protein IJ733_03530 [Lachnospiraceae bacterium]|nr:hypothetical protein [Lachnospiraceae bacterium]